MIRGSINSCDTDTNDQLITTATMRIKQLLLLLLQLSVSRLSDRPARWLSPFNTCNCHLLTQHKLFLSTLSHPLPQLLSSCSYQIIHNRHYQGNNRHLQNPCEKNTIFILTLIVRYSTVVNIAKQHYWFFLMFGMLRYF